MGGGAGGGGKNESKTTSDLGVASNLYSSQVLRDLYESTGPIRSGFLGEWNKLQQGQMPFGDTGYSSMFSAARQPVESQYGQARQNILATNPTGGGLFENLANVETERANTLGNISANYLMDFLNKAYGIGFNAPTTTISGLQNLGIQGQEARNYMLQGGQAASQGIGGGYSSTMGVCCYVVCASGSKDKLLEYVRRYKDSHYDIDSMVAHGYKRFALWFVPSMLKHKIVKRFIKTVMVYPMELYAKAYYEDRLFLKWFFYPISRFWVLTYALVGQFYGLRGWQKYWGLDQVWKKYHKEG